MSLLGRTVGNYRVERLLGAGGMGAVYLAEHLFLRRRVALKTLLPSLANDAELVSRFIGEARATSELHHPHIVEVLDLGEVAGDDGKRTFYFVMEYLEGETLTQRLARGPLPLVEALRVIRQCASALAASHRLGIIHRDLKPANIYLVGAPGAPAFVKLVDFGIARLLDPAINPAAAHRTRTGMLLGTPAFMSPEQTATRGVVDARSDVYSLGVVLYDLVAGRLPFAQREMVELVRAHRTVRPEPPSKHRPGLPAAVDEIVLRALEKDPRDRFPSMDALEAALAGVTGLDYTVADATPAPRIQSPEAIAPTVTTAHTPVTAGRPPAPASAAAATIFAVPPAAPITNRSEPDAATLFGAPAGSTAAATGGPDDATRFHAVPSPETGADAATQYGTPDPDRLVPAPAVPSPPAADPPSKKRES